ncbi:MAG: NAD(+) synthase [Cyclobacteriaceae bacterium]
MSKVLRIGGACLNQTPMDWAGNLSNIKAALRTAQKKKIDILCLPELCITGYGCEDMFLSDWLPQTALNKLLELVPFTLNLTCTIGLPFIIDRKAYNTIAILENGSIKGFYAKHNLANEGVHYEPRWFSSWPYDHVVNIEVDNQFYPFGSIDMELKGVKCGFEICEDAWQEDRPACNLVQDGVELILNPSASHFAFGKETFREQLVVNSSRKFDCVYLYTNLLGNEAGRMIYDGDILIAQKGKLIGHNRRLSFQPFNLLYTDVDFENHTGVANIKKDWSNKTEEFGQALPLALFDYMRKSRSKGFVLSLSGGADSSCIATMVAQMVKIGIDELGVDGFCKRLGITIQRTAKDIVGQILTTAYQGTKNSGSKTKESARELAASIGSTHHEWLIEEEVVAYTSTISKALGRPLDWTKDDIALQNIQARSRSPIIWMLANIKQSLLLTTSNRSEGDVGYATMDGDTSGSISPIAAVDKHFLLQWLEYAERELGYTGLQYVNSLTPTAELRPESMHQTDEDDLMPYKVMVSIERLAIKSRMSPVQVFDQLKSNYEHVQLKEWIIKFFRLWSINQWKRERIAPSFHLDDFNVDPRTWCRFPILSAGFDEELELLRKA